MELENIVANTVYIKAREGKSKYSLNMYILRRKLYMYIVVVIVCIEPQKYVGTLHVKERERAKNGAYKQ